MKPILFSLYTPDSFLDAFKKSNQFEFGNLVIREFPDQEIYIKLNSEVKNRKLIFIASLDKPNPKFLPLIFAIKTARELGAESIGLIVPYLPYMRQDMQFSSGEAVASKYFAAIISDCIDWLITIDPHLHRYHSLNEIYKIPSYVLHATHPMADWIQKQVSSPIMIGPDKESEQWVAAIAQIINSPYRVLEKSRKGDNKVHITFPDLKDCVHLTPVLVDDIISTGATMIETIHHLKKMKMSAPICLGVHAVFAGNAYEQLFSAGAKTVITCNTIEHISNKINVAGLINDFVKNIFAQG